MKPTSKRWVALTVVVIGIGLFTCSKEDERRVAIGDAARSTPSRTFHGYACTEDCSGHKAGYDWAARKGIDDPDDCGGYSQSFIEGCRAYAGGE